MSTIFHVGVVALLAVILSTVLGNFVYLWIVGRRRPLREDGSPAFVSILIPARNEAGRIGKCLESLAAQTYSAFEVVVLDDCSEDETAAVVRAFSGRIPGLRVIDGAPLPLGWIGKPHACAQLAAAARGEWLLFTDADVEFAPDAIARGLHLAIANRADLLTALPRQETPTRAEAFFLPLLYFAVVGFLPMFWMAVIAWSRLAAASGQFMLFRREAYDAVGGHDRVRADIVEDVALGRAIRKARKRLVIVNGVSIARCRMYASWREIVEGFSKNAFAGLGGSVATLVATSVVVVSIFVVPPIGLIGALGAGYDWRWFALETALAAVIRLLLALAFRQPLWSILLHPAAMCAALWIAFRSFWLTRFGGGVRWRGRTY